MEGLREETAEEWPPRAASRFARDDLLELKPNWTAAGPWLARSSLLKSSMDSLLLTIMCVVVSKDAGMKVSEEMWRGRECGIGWASVSGSWTSLSKMRESSARLLQLEREMEEAKENWSLSRDDFRLAPAAAAAAAAPAALLAVEALFWLPDVCLMKSSLSSVSWESFVLLLPSEIGEWIPRLEECAAAEPGLFGEAEPAAAEAPAAVFLLDDEDTEALDRLVKEKLLKSVAGAPWEAPLCALEPRLPSYSVDEGGENIALVSGNQLVCCVGMGGTVDVLLLLLLLLGSICRLSDGRVELRPHSVLQRLADGGINQAKIPLSNRLSFALLSPQALAPSLPIRLAPFVAGASS